MFPMLQFLLLALCFAYITCPTKYAPTTLKAKKNLHGGGGLSTMGGTSKPIPPCSHLAKEEHCRMTFFYFNSTIVDKVVCHCQKKTQCKSVKKTMTIEKFLCK